jgi:hypothetical protein
MNENYLAITEEDFSGNKGDMLKLNVDAIKNDFAYIGLWFACDRSENVYVTTELYRTSAGNPERPQKPSEEITENSFKKSPRKEIAKDSDVLWIAVRREGARYCRMKASPWIDEKSYINYKVIKNRDTTYDTLKSGIIKGDAARFCKIGIEDGTGAVDYNDEILFLVLVRALPPADWKFDPGCFAIQKLPIASSVHFFSVKGKYSPWLGQNPMEGIS